MSDISFYYALEAYEVLQKNGIMSNKHNLDYKLMNGSAIINAMLDSRKFPQKMIFGCIKDFSKNVYLSKKFNNKIYSLNEQIEMLEFDSINSFKDCSGPIPKYLKKNLITVGSGLYLIVNEKEDMTYCHYCWFTPKILDDSKLVTLISSDNNLMADSMNKLLNILKKYE